MRDEPALRHDAWAVDEALRLIDELSSLRTAMLEHEAALAPLMRSVEAAHAAGAANLAHYLAMRRHDLRPLQERLARLGLSSLGRAETHALAAVDKVLGVLHRLAGRSWRPLQAQEPSGYGRGAAALARHADALLGASPAERRTRIMVTLPSQAASDDALVDALVGAGMDIARVNCAHDDPGAWAAMAARVRRSGRRLGRTVRVLMDLGGPKLRTGPFETGEPVVKLRPRRDERGRVVEPARLGLVPAGSGRAVDGADLTLGADALWLAALDDDDEVELSDARGARRRYAVARSRRDEVLLEGRQTAYLTSETRLALRRRSAAPPSETRLCDLPPPPPRILVQRGDRVRLVATGRGRAASEGRPAIVVCTLPEALAAVRAGERIAFDDGRIGGVVRRRSRHGVEVEITQARDGGEWLGADKGINLPDTRLDLPALTDKDLADLAAVARHADLVGLSFAQSAADVQALQRALDGAGAPGLGVVLKIETRRGFEHLPEMLFAAMAGPAAGVMIARGDLAVECGYERLAEVQEEILWACEAAHLPVIWATQVLETLARTGRPSRAEITDAAMGERAECVMLNKGPHIVDAMRTLDDILRRMQTHQQKKRPLLRALRAWTRAPEVTAV